ncbi:hypothetical protein NBRC116583_08220 [Arenicella sp. 4NH20-0111]
MIRLIYTERLSFYVKELFYMTGETQSTSGVTLYHSRLLKHACFWLIYYVLFSLVWAKSEYGYFVSFYLEFVLMPLRILASYCMMYVLVPALLSNRKMVEFLVSYFTLIIVAGAFQLLIGHFFYAQLMDGQSEVFTLSIASWVRNIVLINSTVILLGAVKVIQLYYQLIDTAQLAQRTALGEEDEKIDRFIEVKSDRRIHRLRVEDILYVEGMGNYVTYVRSEDRRTVVYSSLKSAEDTLPESFIRLHRSYLVNRSHISAYDKETVTVGAKTISRAKNITDEMLVVQ